MGAVNLIFLAGLRVVCHCLLELLTLTRDWAGFIFESLGER